MTFSIVARDPHNGDVGVAVASKFLAVGTVVPWARADVGAVATQALAQMAFGPDGLALLAAGTDAAATLQQLLDADPGREDRQVGLVDAHGGSATWTGAACMDWAGGRTGAGYAAQGNILTGPEVVDALAAAFEASSGELAERLLAALAAGDAAGGDRRGRQSAALYVARAGGSYGGLLDRYVDLRVDDHADPVGELARLLRLHRFYLTSPDPATLLPIDPALAREIQAMLAHFGHFSAAPDDQLNANAWSAFNTYAGIENLEERMVGPTHIDPQVLQFMRDQLRRDQG